MPLTEYQKQWLRASGQGAHINHFKACPNLAETLVPKSPEDQARRHKLGGASHTLDVINLLEKDDINGARDYVKQLREQCRESSRGVAKDALPMLQGLGIINDLYHGPVKKPDNLSRARTETTKIRDENL